MYAPEPTQRPPQPETWQPGSRPIPSPPTNSTGYASDAIPGFGTQARAQQALGRWLRIPIDRPLVTPALLVVLFLIYLPMVISSSINEQVLSWGANMHMLVMQGQWYRLITSTFLHASVDGIPFIHLGFNAYALWVIGMELERLMGRARYAAVYAVSGLAGSIASFVFTPANVPSVGASGAIFGLVGALTVYFGLHRKVYGKMGNAWFWNMIVIIALNIGIGFSGFLPVDNSAHVGGLVAGAAMGYVLSPRYALGDWFNILVRNVVNTNRSLLPWLAAGLLGLVVVFAFITLFLMFSAGILQPTYMLGG